MSGLGYVVAGYMVHVCVLQTHTTHHTTHGGVMRNDDDVWQTEYTSSPRHPPSKSPRLSHGLSHIGDVCIRRRDSHAQTATATYTNQRHAEPQSTTPPPAPDEESPARKQGRITTTTTTSKRGFGAEYIYVVVGRSVAAFIAIGEARR